MKLYTLEYDCNKPAVQQINVPTNTDYKVGVKIRRNGEIQSLSPDSITLDGLSADADKTNGYVTFTKSTGDSASYTSENLDIGKGYDFDDTLSYSAGPAQSGDRANFLSAEASAVDLGLAGLEIKLDDIKWGYNTAGTTQVTTADISEWNEAQTYIASQWYFFRWSNGNPALCYQSNKTAFGWFSEDGTQAAWKEKVTVDPKWVLTFGGNGTGVRTSVGKYWVVAYKFKIGTPWSANFKLNTNTFKSQQGDITDMSENLNTAELTGKYADGTDFSFNVVVE